jgi:aminoglycoside phosphotransferase (APT) family kinase protein
MSEGELLTGDGVTQGIVRIGDTVRRPLRPFSLTVQAYLAHLRDAGFAGAPLPFGIDEQGREVLSFVPGDVPRNPLPPETAGDEVLVALARLIRALHEASAGWVPPPDAVWGGTPANLGRPVSERTELVSHCDYYPGNVVFPVFRKLWEDGAKDELPRAEAWLREAAPAITARLGQPG